MVNHVSRSMKNFGGEKVTKCQGLMVRLGFSPLLFSHVNLKQINGVTLPETNIAPENGWLEDYFSFWEGPFSGANC